MCRKIFDSNFLHRDKKVDIAAAVSPVLPDVDHPALQLPTLQEEVHAYSYVKQHA
jgi:hypothetical protein